MKRYSRTEVATPHVDKETGEVTQMVEVFRTNDFGTEDSNIVEKGSFYDPTSPNFNPKLNQELFIDGE